MRQHFRARCTYNEYESSTAVWITGSRSPGRPVARPCRLRAMRMKPTLFLAFLFPPPASGALRFVGGDRPRAGCATDGREALCVTRVDRELVAGHEGQQPLARPVEQRVELDQTALGFGGDQCHVLTVPTARRAAPRSSRARRQAH